MLAFPAIHGLIRPWSFQSGFGCAACHGMEAQGARGPGLSGGFDADSFEHTHGPGSSRRMS